MARGSGRWRAPRATNRARRGFCNLFFGPERAHLAGCKLEGRSPPRDGAPAPPSGRRRGMRSRWGMPIHSSSRQGWPDASAWHPADSGAMRLARAILGRGARAHIERPQAQEQMRRRGLRRGPIGTDWSPLTRGPGCYLLTVPNIRHGEVTASRCHTRRSDPHAVGLARRVVAWHGRSRMPSQAVGATRLRNDPGLGHGLRPSAHSELLNQHNWEGIGRGATPACNHPPKSAHGDSQISASPWCYSTR